MNKWIAVSLTLMVLLVVSLSPAWADEVTDTYLDTNGTIPDVVVTRGSLDGSIHYRGTSNISPDVNNSGIEIRFPVPADSISQLSITFDAVGGSCFSNRITSMYITDEAATTVLMGPYSTSTCGNGETTLTFNGFVDNPSEEDQMSVFISVNRRVTVAGSGSHYVRLKSVSVTYIELGTTPEEGTIPDGLIRPLAQNDEDPEWGLFESENENAPYEHTVFNFSEEIGDFVLNAHDGIVTAIVQVTSSNCGFSLPSCHFELPIELTGFSDEDYELRFGITTPPIYFVTVEDFTNGVGYEYIVSDAHDYLTVGDTINGGCILGKSIEFHHAPGDVMEQGIAILNAYDLESTNTLEVFSKLNNHGIPENACNVDPLFSACISDGDLTDDSVWEQSGLVTFNDPGFTLGSGGKISQSLNLDTEQESSLTVGARLISFTGGTGNFRLQLGEEIENFPINNDTRLNEVVEYKIPLDLYEADAGLFYTAAISAVGNYQMEVLYACVTQGDDAPPSPSSQCYFANHSFDYGTTDWTVFGDVIAEQGDVTLTDGSHISQAITLLPNEDDSPHEYEVLITFQAVFTAPPFLILDPVDYVMEWRFPGGGDWTATGVSITSVAEFTQTFIVEIEEETSGEFSVRPNITDSDDSFVGVRVLSLCIKPPFPGQVTYEGDYFFTFNCTYISKPPSGSQQLSDWTQYHWLNLRRFFDCDLMVLLRRLEQSINAFFRVMLWVMRYWMSYAFMGAEWAGEDLFPWLDGHFHNMAVGQTTFITAGEESCGNIFCFFTDIFATGGNVFSDLISAIQGIFSDLAGVLQTLINQLGGLLSQIVAQIVAPIINAILGIIGQGFSLFLAIVTGIVTIAFSLIGKIFSFFDQLLGLVNIILTAWNTATPTAIPGLPACELDPQSSGICIGLWFMENTIFSGTGAVLIPLIIGYGSIMLILWAIGTFKKTLMETATAL